MSSQRRAWLVLVAASLLVLVSAAVLLLVPTSGASFGWFAYAPLAGPAVAPGLLFLDPLHRWSAVVGVVALIVVSWAAGFLAGRRAR